MSKIFSNYCFKFSFGLVVFICLLTNYNYFVAHLSWENSVKLQIRDIHGVLVHSKNPNVVYPEIHDSFPIFNDVTVNTEVKEVINNLEVAAQRNPSRSATYYMLGQIYAASNDWIDTLRVLQYALNADPRNLRVAWQTALSLERINPYSPQLGLLYRAAGYDSEQFQKAADHLVQSFDFERAGLYYKRAALLTAELVPDRFAFEFAVRKLLSKIRINNNSIDRDINLVRQFDNDFLLNKLDSRLRISGSDFRLATSISPPTVTFGTRLDSPGENSVGMLWWTSQSMAIVSVTHTSNYQISINLRHSSPPPVEVAVGINSQPSHRFTLVRGDNSWETFAFTINLASGIHTIDIWFLNNAIVDDKDRDAAINWLILEESTIDRGKQ